MTRCAALALVVCLASAACGGGSTAPIDASPRADASSRPIDASPRIDAESRPVDASQPDGPVSDAAVLDAAAPDAAGADAAPPDFSELPEIELLVPWTPVEFQSTHANARELDARFCYDPASGDVWILSDEVGCDAAHTEPAFYGLSDYIAYINAHPEYGYLVPLQFFFPAGTFTDRTMQGVTVEYDSALGAIYPDMPAHAYNLHDPRTQDIFAAAARALIGRFGSTKAVIGYEIGWNIYQENLTGDFGFSVEALNRFREAWAATLEAGSTLDAATLADVDALVAALDPADPTTWPLPVAVDDHANYTETAASRAQRFYYAYFQRFRQADVHALQQRLYETVREEAGPAAWVEMFNSQLYTNHAVPSPVVGAGFVQLGELAMLPVLDPSAPALESLGKDEGMAAQGYALARCVDWCEPNPTHPPYGVCPSTRGDLCVCEDVENGCVDDWSVDRTIAYLRRGLANGVRHRVAEGYVRSGYSVTPDGLDWAFDEAVRAADFALIDGLVFGDYSRPGEPSFEAQIDRSSPVEVRLFYPVSMLGAVPQLWGPIPFDPGRADVDYLHNLLESRGVKFQPINEDWTGLDTPVIVPYFDYLEPILAEIPGYDADKVIGIPTIEITYPSPVDDAYSESILAAIQDKTGPLRMPITVNPLDRGPDPTNLWAAESILRVGAVNNVVYNLSPETRCVGLEGGRTMQLAPFETRFLADSVDDGCAP